MARWYSSLLLAWLAACGAAGREELGEQARGLVGGAPAPSATAVCALTVRTATGELGLCSGAVLSRHLLLTAAHCVSPGSVGKDATFSVACAERVPVDGGIPPGSLSVDWTLPHPAFDPWFLQGGADVGLVSTDEALPAAPMPLRRGALPMDGGSFEIALYGYGAAAPGDAGEAGQRRVLPSTAHMTGPTFLELEGGGSGACGGDSGGPVLVEGELAGVISYAQGGCAGEARAVAVEPVLEFLDGWRERDESGAQPPGGEKAGSGCASAPLPPSAWLAWALLLRRGQPRRR